MANPQDIVIGRNFTISINDGFGAVIQLNRLKSFTPRPKIKELESQDFNGINRHRDVYQGYEGDLEFESIDDSIDSYFAIQEALYLTGAIQQYNTVTETINYANGSRVQYMYTYMILTPTDFGDRRPDEYVMPKVKFKCAQRIKLN